MATASWPGCSIRFGDFGVDPATGRLYRRGVRIPIRGKSLELLLALIERPGQVVTREQLRRRLWPGDVFVDFDNNLNTAAARLREALHDPAARPKFVETVPRRGYRFIGRVDSPPAEPAGRPIRLVVLPLLNLCGDPAQDYLCESLTEEIIFELATLAPRDLAVIARTTAMCFRSSTLDIARIGQTLNVEYAVESSLRLNGDSARLIVQLIRTADQMHVWSHAYDASLSDLLSLKSAAARDIAREAGVPPPTTGATPARDPVAYQRYLQGRFQLNKLTRDGLLRAGPLFEEAIARDPEFALAHDALSELIWWQGFLALTSPKEAFAKGVWPALRALEIDPNLAETHALLGMYLKETDYNWAEVQREMARALELNPSSPLVRFRYALSGLMPHGHLREAAAELERALELDPLSVNVRMWLAEMLHLARENGRAAEQIRLVIEMDPEFCWGHMTLGQIQLGQQRIAEAVATLHRAASLSGGHPIVVGWLGLALAHAGLAAEARALLESLRQAATGAYIPPTSLAWIHLGLNETSAAFEYMFEAVEQRDPILIPLKSYWFFDPLRQDARYAALLSKLHLDSPPAPASPSLKGPG
jgi:TolB-like protein/DNA-binding winged helix-turn-helix (wHTH) protein/predicted Zn-dependent protease